MICLAAHLSSMGSASLHLQGSSSGSQMQGGRPRPSGRRAGAAASHTATHTRVISGRMMFRMRLVGICHEGSIRELSPGRFIAIQPSSSRAAQETVGETARPSHVAAASPAQTRNVCLHELSAMSRRPGYISIELREAAFGSVTLLHDGRAQL